MNPSSIFPLLPLKYRTDMLPELPEKRMKGSPLSGDGLFECLYNVHFNPPLGDVPDGQIKERGTDT
nr:MAG TPA: hypothetical protein [Caudoviricetes sp.]